MWSRICTSAYAWSFWVAGVCFWGYFHRSGGRRQWNQWGFHFSWTPTLACLCGPPAGVLYSNKVSTLRVPPISVFWRLIKYICMSYHNALDLWGISIPHTPVYKPWDTGREILRPVRYCLSREILAWDTGCAWDTELRSCFWKSWDIL